jgi:DNA-binding NtrC family response regulator
MQGKTVPAIELPEVINLLFVDDDTSYVAAAQQLLSKYEGKKFNITWKQGGAAAIEELERNSSFDVIMIDYYLPEINGMDVIKTIREKKFETPVVLLTSNRDFRLAIEALKYGVEDYVVKDEAVESVLPRIIVNVLERVQLKRMIAHQAKADLIAKKRTDAIQELVVTVCHEFNNPLAAMKISVDILARQQLTPGARQLIEQLDKNIGLIEAETIRLRDINFDSIELEKG